MVKTVEYFRASLEGWEAVAPAREKSHTALPSQVLVIVVVTVIIIINVIVIFIVIQTVIAIMSCHHYLDRQKCQTTNNNIVTTMMTTVLMTILNTTLLSDCKLEGAPRKQRLSPPVRWARRAGTPTQGDH